MKISKESQVFLLIFIFLGAGSIFLFGDKQSNRPVAQNQSEDSATAQPLLLVNKDYASQVREWLGQVNSPEALPAVRTAWGPADSAGRDRRTGADHHPGRPAARVPRRGPRRRQHRGGDPA